MMFNLWMTKRTPQWRLIFLALTRISTFLPPTGYGALHRWSATSETVGWVGNRHNENSPGEFIIWCIVLMPRELIKGLLVEINPRIINEDPRKTLFCSSPPHADSSLLIGNKHNASRLHDCASELPLSMAGTAN